MAAAATYRTAGLLLTVCWGVLAIAHQPGTRGADGTLHLTYSFINTRSLLQASPRRGASAASSRRSRSNSTTGALCQWNPSDSTCTPTHEAWLSAGPGLPSSHYRRAVLMASDRDKHCSQHSSAAACASDAQMRCFWQGGANSTNARCASSDMEEMLLWSAKGFMTNMSVIPHAMTCPGTPARTFFDCYAFAGRLDTCKDLPRCTILANLGTLKNVCVPTSFQEKKMSQLRQLFIQLDGLNTTAFGSCGAACWLRQARECVNVTTQAACAAVPHCAWDEAAAKKARTSILVSMWDDDDNDNDADGEAAVIGSRALNAKAVKPRACRHKSQEFSAGNAVDQAAEKIYQRCSAATTAAACRAVKAAASPAAAASRAAPVDWKSYEPPKAAERCVLLNKPAGRG